MDGECRSGLLAVKITLRQGAVRSAARSQAEVQKFGRRRRREVASRSRRQSSPRGRPTPAADVVGNRAFGLGLLLAAGGDR
jgi:hypothetical protein